MKHKENNFYNKSGILLPLIETDKNGIFNIKIFVADINGKTCFLKSSKVYNESRLENEIKTTIASTVESLKNDHDINIFAIVSNDSSLQELDQHHLFSFTCNNAVVNLIGNALSNNNLYLQVWSIMLECINSDFLLQLTKQTKKSELIDNQPTWKIHY